LGKTAEEIGADIDRKNQKRESSGKKFRINECGVISEKESPK